MAYQKIILPFLSISAFLYPVAAAPNTSPPACSSLLATVCHIPPFNRIAGSLLIRI